ncbi:MAG: ABC transporter ATP-binding protein [Chitinophagales bacterium]|nr:ABC transporter ATP-binding protein [Chitinophagales bacterium]
MIEIKNLTHEYDNFRALHNVNLTIKENEITAIVGPNGAGKTTLLSNICGLLKPTEGEIIIDGLNVYDNPRKIHQIIGYLPDLFGLYANLSVKQHLQLALENHEIDKTLHNKYLEETLHLIGLEDKINNQALELSRGMKQRLAIGQTIIWNPQYLILDEPASGLDPEARLNLSKLFIHLKEKGISLIVSSHILAELEEYATDLVVIRNGNIYNEENDTAQVSETSHTFITLCIKTDGLCADLISAIQLFDNNIQCTEKNEAVFCQFIKNKQKQTELLQFLLNKQQKIYHLK